MARTPSMSTAEAEAILGPRGSLFVTADNVHTARKWLTANGVPGLYAAGLARAALAGIYNDSTNVELERAKTKASEAAEETSESTDEPAKAAPVAAAPTATPDMAQALAALSTLFGQGGMNADQVRTIVRDELPNLIPVTRLEIVTNGEAKDHGTAPRHKQLPELIRALSCGVPAALVGPAGSGKTTAAEQAAAALGHEFYIQGAIQGAHELLGFVDAQGRYQTTPFRQAFEHGGTICLDELDAGDPAGMLVCNSALSNCYMPFPDQAKPVKRHESFNVVACLNTFGNGADRLYVGRNQMDAATLDRFAFINWRYDEILERTIAGNDSWVDRVQALRRGVEKEKARMVISPRASIYGAKMLAAGAIQSDVENVLVWKGTDSDLRRRVESHA